MMRAVGMVVGSLLMLAVFLLALGAGSAWLPLQKAASRAVDVPAGPEAVEERAVEDAVDAGSPRFLCLQALPKARGWTPWTTRWL